MEYDRAVCFHPVLLSVTYTLGHIMRNAWLAELQDGVKIGGRNINNLRNADDTTNGRKQRGPKEPLGECEGGE